MRRVCGKHVHTFAGQVQPCKSNTSILHPPGFGGDVSSGHCDSGPLARYLNLRTFLGCRERWSLEVRTELVSSRRRPATPRGATDRDSQRVRVCVPVSVWGVAALVARWSLHAPLWPVKVRLSATACAVLEYFS